MDLLLQFGYGMMEHCRTLCTAWSGATVVLSPRDLDPEQLVRLANELRGRHHGKVLLDPQFYLPHADHERLTSHAYWPAAYATGAFWSGPPLEAMLNALATLNAQLGTEAVVLPGLLALAVDDDWLAVQKLVATQARRLMPNQRLIATIALSADAMRSTAQVEELLEETDEWPVDGIYLVAEHPNSSYVVEDANWLANELDIVAHVRLAGRRVIVGYCTHQMLLLGVAGCRELSSGTWMNVRSFPPGKFKTALEEEIKQRTTWYFCPQSLSEYKLPFLDIAWRQGMLDAMRPAPSMGSAYADPLFSGAQPSTVDFAEPAAFRHYLQCFHTLAAGCRQPSFDETLRVQHDALAQAERLCAQLANAGVTGQLRDFARSFDASRAALAVLTSTRGPLLRRRWASL